MRVAFRPATLAACSLLVTAGVLPGCGHDRDPATPDTSTRPDPTWGNECTAKNDEADLMGWDAGSRANVSIMRRQGVLAVRYATEGCKVSLELIPNCIGEGKYTFSPYSATDKRVAHNQTELAAKLPLFSLNVGGSLTTGRALRTDFDLAGVASLPIGKPFSRADLSGQGCDRATHVVSRVYLGGFAIMTGESRSIEAAISVFGVGAKGSDVREAQQLATEGNADACKTAQQNGTESPMCSVPLRLALMPINDATGADYAAARKVPNKDEHGCEKGRQVWNGRACEELKLNPNGTEIYDSFRFKK